MKKTARKGLCGILTALVCLLGAASPMPALAAGGGPSVSAQSAVLLSAASGQVLWEKNAYERRPMASTTKILTALLALEEAQREQDPAVKITQEMVAVEGSSMGLKAGDELTLSGLAAGMLLASGNDAANAAALTLGESLEGFARLMNRRAEEIGMKDSHFVTPSGLDDPEHYSTAYDMALLAREALKNPSFAELAASASYPVEFTEPPQRITYSNHNKLLGMYQGCVGVKTGFTKKSGRCLVSAAEREGVTLIAVTLNAPDDWNDHTALLDYGFSTLEEVVCSGEDFAALLPLVGGGRDTLAVTGGPGGALLLPKKDVELLAVQAVLPPFVYAPVQAGDRVGELRFCLKGEVLATAPLTARESAGYWERQPGFWEKLFGK